MESRWKKFSRDKLVDSRKWYFKDWGLFAYSFKQSADLVYAKYRETRREAFWFPAIFLYRQWIELALKSLWSAIERLDKSLGPTPHVHKLTKIWPPIKSWLIDRNFFSVDDKFVESAERIFAILDSIDPRATAFRYPPLELPHSDIINFSLDDFDRAVDEIDTVFFALRNMMNDYQDHLAESLGYS
jgi:hypothetical protein